MSEFPRQVERGGSQFMEYADIREGRDWAHCWLHFRRHTWKPWRQHYGDDHRIVSESFICARCSFGYRFRAVRDIFDQ